MRSMKALVVKDELRADLLHLRTDPIPWVPPYDNDSTLDSNNMLL